MEDLRPKAIGYIDGYNWYHAIFKHFPQWKWINVQSFFEALRPHENIVSVKIFSAMIDPDKPSSDARERQQRYFDVLRTLPKVRVILGKFQPREVTCQAGCKGKYLVQEEKKTDVNIAVELLSDAFSRRCENMHIISGDSDLQPAVEWIVKNVPSIKMTVYVPALEADQRNRRTDYYLKAGLKVDCKFLPLGNIKDHQLKNVVKCSDGTFRVRPHVWA